MQTKRFVPCLYLYNEHAIKSMFDYAVVETDAFKLIDSFIASGADEIIIFDLANTEDEFKISTAIIGEIIKTASTNNINVIVGGNITTMAEVHKYIELGASQIILDLEVENSIVLIENAADCYGKEIIIAAYNNATTIDANLEIITNTCSTLILMNPHQIRETIAITNMPMYVQINQIALNKLLEIFAYPSICGVTGNTINDNLSEINTLKNFCIENDIPVIEKDNTQEAVCENVLTAAFAWEDFKLNNDGMVPVIVQDYKNNEVLMLAYMNKEAYDTTIRTGTMTYYSRSRDELWIKGLTSGHFQYVKSLDADCDMDTILAKVDQVGAACHTGSRSCFFNEISRKA